MSPPPQRLSLRTGSGSGCGSGCGSGSGSVGFLPTARAAPQLSSELAPAARTPQRHQHRAWLAGSKHEVQGTASRRDLRAAPLPAPAPGGTPGTRGWGEARGTGRDLETSHQWLPGCRWQRGLGATACKGPEGAPRKSQPARAAAAAGEAGAACFWHRAQGGAAGKAHGSLGAQPVLRPPQRCPRLRGKGQPWLVAQHLRQHRAQLGRGLGPFPSPVLRAGRKGRVRSRAGRSRGTRSPAASPLHPDGAAML